MCETDFFGFFFLHNLFSQLFTERLIQQHVTVKNDTGLYHESFRVSSGATFGLKCIGAEYNTDTSVHIINVLEYNRISQWLLQRRST